MTVILLSPTSDIFASDAHYLVNPVDCTGAQGKGLALAFRLRYPADCDWFKRFARAGNVDVGHVYQSQGPTPRLIFLPTKLHYSEPSALADVRAGLHALTGLLVKLNAKSVAIPALGCGHGGLAWDDVRPLIEEQAGYMAGFDIRVEIYPPHEVRKTRSRGGSIQASRSPLMRRTSRS